MTSVHAIMVLIIRLWAADSVIGALFSLPSGVVMAFTSSGDGSALSITYFAGSFVWLIIGAMAWFIAPWFARHIYPMGANSQISSNVDATSLVTIGSFLIGIFYLGQYGVPLLVEWGGWVAERMGETPPEERPYGALNKDAYDWENLIANILIVIAACVMTFRPSYLARIFGWLQSTGHYKDAEEKS